MKINKTGMHQENLSQVNDTNREEMDDSIRNNNNIKTKGDNKVPFEDALDKTGFGLYSWLLTALNGLSIIAYACTLYSSTIVVKTSACDLRTTPYQQGLIVAAPLQGLIVAAPLVAAVLGSVLWGYLADKHGRRRMLLVSFFLATVFHCIATFSVNWIMLLVCLFIASLCQYSITMTLLSECVPQARRNLVVLVVASLFLLSQGIMALMAMPIMSMNFSHHMPALGIFWNPWRTTLLVYSTPGIICFYWMFFMQESPKYAFIKHGEEKALTILKRIHRVNHLKTKEEFNVTGLVLNDENLPINEENPKPNIKELFKGKLLRYFILMTILAMFLQFTDTLKSGGDQSLTLCKLMKDVIKEKDECSLNQSGLLIVVVVAVLQSFFNSILAFLVGKFGRRNMVMVVASVCGMSGIIVNLVPNAIASMFFFIIFLMGILLLGLYTAISVALFPTHLRALAISLTMSGGRITLFACILILKFLMENHYCDIGFYIFATFIAFSAVVAFLLPDDRFINVPEENIELRQLSDQQLDDSEDVIYRKKDNRISTRLVLSSRRPITVTMAI
ncbi:major facilitator superfamily domain-containing protein [Phthorimaea operculella]|nr:major facilitator superfamily domain-containing protein [Phthorimaea operculella]